MLPEEPTDVSKTSPNPPTRMVSMKLIRVLCKQFGGVTRELMRKKLDMISHARHHVYTRIKKG